MLNCGREPADATCGDVSSFAGWRSETKGRRGRADGSGASIFGPYWALAAIGLSCREAAADTLE